MGPLLQRESATYLTDYGLTTMKIRAQQKSHAFTGNSVNAEMALNYVIVLGLFVSGYCQNESSWQKYIVGPQERIVYPQRIVSVSGNVTNAQAVIQRSGDLVLSRSEQDETPPAVILDFGINVVGFLRVAFNGATANRPGIRIAFSETLQFLSDLSDYSRSNGANPITPGSDQIAVPPDPFTWNDTWGCRNGSQVCSDGLHGFRYIKIYLDALESDAPITSAHGTVNISLVYLEYSAFLATPETFTGWFECSDIELNAYWYSAVYTNDMTTDQFRENDVDPRGAYNPDLEGKLVLFDGAKRDRDPYVGDVAISGVTTYLSHNNLSSIAAENLLADLGNHQRQDGFIPPASISNYTLQLFDYPLWWVISVHDYVIYTGKMDFLEQYFTSLEKVLDDFYLSHSDASTGLVSRPAGYGDFAFVNRDGIVSYYNALYVLALKAGATCAEWMARNQTSAKWLQRGGNISNSINTLFWDDNAGAYRNSESSTSHPQDANAIAILAGVADPEQAKSILDYLTKTTSRAYGNAFMDDDSLVTEGSQRVYAFISAFEIRARFMIGDAGSALDEIHRLHGWMLAHDPSSTFWEGIGSDGSLYEGGFTSAAHGWSTGIVAILTNYILGMHIVSPGGLAWELSPVAVNNVTWAQGRLFTTEGPLDVYWGDFEHEFVLNITVPRNTRGKVKIPPISGKKYFQVFQNDLKVWENGKSEILFNTVSQDENGFIILPNVGAGNHIIVARV